MKMLKKQILNKQEATRLIEAYYKGETSAEEEQKIALFLKYNDSPEYDAERAMFDFFAEKKKKKTYRLPAAVRGIAAAVAVLFVAGGFYLSTQSQAKSYAWVDGEKISSKKDIRALALAGVQGFAASQQYDIESDLQFILVDDIIESQLKLFVEH